MAISNQSFLLDFVVVIVFLLPARADLGEPIRVGNRDTSRRSGQWRSFPPWGLGWILDGPYQNRTARVYAVWDERGRVRVQLDEKAKQECAPTFFPLSRFVGITIHRGTSECTGRGEVGGMRGSAERWS